MTDYNYAVFDLERGAPEFGEFQNRLHAGERAPDHSTKNQVSGGRIPLKSRRAETTPRLP